LRIVSLQLLIAAAACAAAFLVTRITINQMLFLFMPPMLVCIVCGWILMFESRAVRRASDFKEAMLLGVLVPVPSNWTKPVRISWAARVLLVCAAVPAGAALRLLWLVAK